MNISDFLKEEVFKLQLESKNKRGVIEELADLLLATKKVKNRKVLLEAIIKREELESTGIGEGVAIPHARSNAVKDVALAFGLSREGIEFGSGDRRPAHFVFLIVAPVAKDIEYIRLLASVARLLSRGDFRKKAKKVSSYKEMVELIKNYEQN